MHFKVIRIRNFPNGILQISNFCTIYYQIIAFVIIPPPNAIGKKVLEVLHKQQLQLVSDANSTFNNIASCILLIDLGIFIR